MSERLTDAEIDAALEVCEKATSEPWYWRSCGEKSNDAQLFTAIDMDFKNETAEPHFPPGELDLEKYNDETGGFDQIADVDTALAGGEDINFADYDFMAKARTLLPRALKELRERRKDSGRLRQLVRHCWIHDGYPNNGYLQMTTEQKQTYCDVIGAEFAPLAPDFDTTCVDAIDAAREE